MPIESISEVQEYLQTNAENEEIKTFLAGLSKPAEITLEGVQKAVKDKEELKKWLDSEKDKHYNKALKTWQDNNLQPLIDAKVKELYPEADPKDKEIAQVKAALEEMKQESLRKDLATKAIKLATDKGISLNLIESLLPSIPDEKALEAVIESIEKEMQEAIKNGVETEVKKRLEDSNYTPPNGGNNPPIGGADFFKVIKDNQVKR